MKTRHFAQLVALSALWGASFIFIRLASPLLGPWPLSFLRIGLATLTLALLMRALGQRWPGRGHWGQMALLAVLSVATPSLLYNWAALHLPAGYSALLNTTAVLFGTLMAAWFKEESLTVSKLLGCAAGFAGVALILGLGPVALTGVTLLAALACLLAAASYGVSTTLMKRATARIEPLAIAAAIHLVALGLLSPGALLTLPSARFTPTALVAVAITGVVTSGLAYWLHLRLMRHVSAVASMSPAFMIPLFGVAWGWLFLDEPLGSGLVAGGLLILLATGLVTGYQPWRRPAVPEPPA